ncbi:cyclophilin-like fold protein [bacterium]|nr:cyclophilin-like fold protein [bacterium]
MKKIILKFKDKELILNLRNTPTANLIYDSLPFSSLVKKWGEEIYFEIPIDIELEDNARTVVKFGEIAFWNEGSAIAIGYGKTPVSNENEIRLISPCNIWADSSFDKNYIEQIKENETVDIKKL